VRRNPERLLPPSTLIFSIIGNFSSEIPSTGL
jgi:hypothetical protein